MITSNFLTKKGHGFTLMELMVAVLIVGVLAAVMVPMLALFGTTARIAAMEADISKMTVSIESSLGRQDRDKLLVENGGKFPPVSLTLNDKVGTIYAGTQKDTVEVPSASSSFTYDIATDLDGYIIQAYSVSSLKNEKELVGKFDSNVGKVEHIK